MNRSRRWVARLLLAGMLAISLLLLVYPARAQAQGGRSGIHIVEAGETLSEIARQYNTDVATLLALNNLSNANLVYVGQQLVVSGGGGWERSSRANEEPDFDGPRYQRQGRSWDPQQSQPSFQRPDEGWQPQSSSYGQGRAGVAWEPQVNWGRPTGQPIRWADDELETEGWEPQYSEGDSYPARDGWEQQRGTQYGREVELTGEKWIDIDLSEQVLTAYQGDTAVRIFLISSGSATYPTVTGSFRTYARVEVQDMWGGSQADGTYYFQADVPWVQYFYEDYAIHGAYWHNNFGRPIGHGCINMRVEDSRWLYEWTGVTGIRVEVHE